MKTTYPPTEASRQHQRARAEFIARAVAAALAIRDNAESLVAAIHLALDATEPTLIDQCPCGTVLSAHEKTTGKGDCFGCRADAWKGGAL